MTDAADNCPDAANAGQGDADGDGVGDACEIFKSGATPIEAGGGRDGEATCPATSS